MKRILLLCGLLIVTASIVAFQDAGMFSQHVTVVDGNGLPRAVLFSVNNNGRSGMEIKDANGSVRYSVYTNATHDPSSWEWEFGAYVCGSFVNHMVDGVSCICFGLFFACVFYLLRQSKD